MFVFAVFFVGKFCSKLDILLVKFLEKFSKVGFSNSMVISANPISVFSSIFLVLFSISCLSISIYSAVSSNVVFGASLYASVLVAVVPGEVTTDSVL